MVETIENRRIDIGELKVYPFVSSRFRLDGCSMFGVVPRVLWEKSAPPDSRGRIELTTNSLLIETANELVLVETGMGYKYDDGAKDIYALADEGIIEGLAELGVSPADITMVILTHLHFDHAGGSTLDSDDGDVTPTFPEAIYVIQQEEWHEAGDPHPLARDSYEEADFFPLMKGDRVRLVSGDECLLPGILVEKTGGHTLGHQIVKLESRGERGVYTGDVLPTTAHLRMKWMMAWDLYPTLLWEAKARLLGETSEDGAVLFFAHDPALFGGRIEPLSASAYQVSQGSGIAI